MRHINQQFQTEHKFEILKHNDLIKLYRDFFKFINYTRLSNILNDSLIKKTLFPIGLISV